MPSVATHVHCLVLTGPDARRFAQAQFAGDVDRLTPGHWQWNAWLDARGRVRALMHLVDPGDGRLLALLRGGDADQVCAALARFRLHARVELAAQVFAGALEGAMATGTVAADSAGLAMGHGNFSLRLLPPGIDLDPAAAHRWRLAGIRAGWPTLPAGEPGFLPPALGLERLGAVAFDKGCYPGQEIAARLHYRGGHKQGLFHLRGPGPLAGGARLPDEGFGPLCVLDAVAGPDLTDALVVASRLPASIINVLGNLYDVVSRFEA